ncbi:hypothetical protein V8E36_004462 [Tilletia maclaganii]
MSTSGSPTPVRRRTPAQMSEEKDLLQPPRQHNAELAQRYQRTMAEARKYRNPPIFRRLLLILFVLLLLYSASRLQFKARSQVLRWQLERAVAKGQLDPDMMEGDEYDAYAAAADGASFFELFGMGSEGLI